MLPGLITSEDLMDSKNEMILSPQKIRYRNNILFSIGYDSNGILQVGPLLKNGTVESAETNLLISELGISVCYKIREFIQNHSNLSVSVYPKFQGFWRHIQIRENTSEEFMITFRFHNFQLYESMWNMEKSNLIQYLVLHFPKILQIHYQICQGKSEPTFRDPLYTIYYVNPLLQKMCQKTFLIDPLVFFQVNYGTAELMFQRVKDIVLEIKPDANTMLLDLCCGIGIYSILLSDLFQKVIGIDHNPRNIETANMVAKFNQIAHLQFYEDDIKNTPKYVSQNKLIVIVNPSRSGLSKDSINILSQLNYLHLIYISCSVDSLTRDLNALKIDKLEKVILIDQFVGTKFLEIITHSLLPTFL